MSWWTYINGTITVNPMGRTQAEKRYILDTVLAHLPIVTGSEHDMDVYVIQKNGYNSSSSCDEFGQCTNNLIDRYDGHSPRGWLRVQNDYLLVVDASLRDREFDQTFREFMKWLCRLSKRICIKSILVKIEGYDQQYVIDESAFKNPYYEMFEDPTWCGMREKFDPIKDPINEPNWCEYLMWDRMKDGMYPMMLGYKYFSDEENDTEVERRLLHQYSST